MKTLLSVLGLLLLATPATAQNMSRTMDECRPVPIGGGVSFQPECPRSHFIGIGGRTRDIDNMRRLLLSIPASCRVVDRKQNVSTGTSTIILQCPSNNVRMKPPVIRDDYGRPRLPNKQHRGRL